MRARSCSRRSSTRAWRAATVAGAAAAAQRLAELAASSGIGWSAARAQLATARVHLAARADDEAAEPARRALAAFGLLAMPLDDGRGAAGAGARAGASDRRTLAREEARAAFAAFRELGASRAMDAAAAVLRDLGGGDRRAPAHATAS